MWFFFRRMTTIAAEYCQQWLNAAIFKCRIPGSGGNTMKLICKRKRTNRQEGFTFIEILIAIALLAFGLLGMASMQVMAMKTNSKANRITERTTIGMNKIESLMIQAEQDYDGITGSSDSTGSYDITWSVGVDEPSTPIPNAVLPIKRKKVTLYIRSNSTALNDKPVAIKGILMRWPQ